MFVRKSELRETAYIKTAAQIKSFTEIVNHTNPARFCLQVGKMSKRFQLGVRRRYSREGALQNTISVVTKMFST